MLARTLESQVIIVDNWKVGENKILQALGKGLVLPTGVSGGLLGWLGWLGSKELGECGLLQSTLAFHVCSTCI